MMRYSIGFSIGALLACLAVQADPEKYWFVGAAGSIKISEANCLFEDSTRAAAAFVDGNWLCATAPSVENRQAWVPAHVNAAVKTYGWGGAIGFDRDTSVYGLFLQTGGRNWTLYNKLTVGAGGMNGNTGWSPLTFASGGANGLLHIAGTQTWLHNNMLDFSVPVTTDDDTVWTFNGTSTAYRFVRFAKACALAKTDIVVTGYTVIGVGTTAGTIGARSLTLKGAHAGFYLTQKHGDESARLPSDSVVDGRFTDAEYITLRDGVSLSAANYFNGAVLDPSIYFKVSGTGAAIGADAAYSVKDGGTFTISVDAGATLLLESLPTAGKLKIIGSGSLKASNSTVLEGMAEKCDVSEFAGAVGGGTLTYTKQVVDIPSIGAYTGYNLVFKDCAVRIRDVSGYSGTITLGSEVEWCSQSLGSNKCNLAMPPTSTWSAGLKVVVGTRSRLYLPDTTDDGIADKVTGPYTIGCRGWTKEPAGTHEFPSGSLTYVIGDGFESDSSIRLTGGTLFFPVGATVAAPVTQLVCTASNNTHSIVGAGVRATVNFTAPFYSNSNASGLTISNDCDAVYRSSSTRGTYYDYELGTVVFSGGGELVSYIKQHAGDLEFRGGTWKMRWGNNPAFTIQHFACHTRFTDNVDFEMINGCAKDSTTGSRENGLEVNCSAIYGRGIIVEAGSTLTIGAYRNMALGGAYSASSALLWAKGGRIRIKGPGGQFSLRAGTKPTDLKNSTSDRCGCFILRATEGGEIETERVLTSYPVAHGAPSLENDNYMCQQTARPGLHVELNNGTLKYGANFGVSDGHDGLCRPFLFGQGLTLYSNTTYAPDYDHTADVRFFVGENGGTLDLSAVTAYTVISNTIPDTPITGANTTVFPDGNYPNLGPRWDVRGLFTVKGNGAQTFVIHDVNDNATFTNVVVDGVTMKVVSDTAKTYKDIAFGAKPGALVVESKDGTQNKAVSFTAATVAEGGAFQASLFNAVTTIPTLAFGADSTLYACTRADNLPVIGAATLAAAMTYSAQANDDIVALVADSVTGTPTWTRGASSSKRCAAVSATRVHLLPAGLQMNFR